jgi:hypothetical protein
LELITEKLAQKPKPDYSFIERGLQYVYEQMQKQSKEENREMIKVQSEKYEMSEADFIRYLELNKKVLDKGIQKKNQEIGEFIKHYAKRLEKIESETEELLKGQANQYGINVLDWVRYIQTNDKIHGKAKEKQRIETEKLR